MAETTVKRLNPETDKALIEGKIKFNESYGEFPLFLTDQPERSKREDSLLRELIENCPSKLDISENAEPPLVWDKDLNFIGHQVLEEMRCSEHCGNTVREVQ